MCQLDQGENHGNCEKEGCCTCEEGCCTCEEGRCTCEEGRCTCEEGRCTCEEGRCTCEEGCCTCEEGCCTCEEGCCTCEEGCCTCEEGCCQESCTGQKSRCRPRKKSRWEKARSKESRENTRCPCRSDYAQPESGLAISDFRQTLKSACLLKQPGRASCRVFLRLQGVVLRPALRNF